MQKYIAHVDMDCFFAACEEKRNPAFKHKPLAVGAIPSQKRGVLCTANYAARKFGVRSALPIQKAVALCPEAIYLKPDMQYYKQESKKVMAILASFATHFEQVSVDEAYLDITEYVQTHNSLEEAIRTIHKTVIEQTQLTCSIGVAESRTVAKIASDYKKPAGITIVHDAQSFLAPLKIEKLPGLGKKACVKLHSMNIHTLGDLAKAEIFDLLDIFGSWIVKAWNVSRGKDTTGVATTQSKAKSVSRESTFMENITIADCKTKAKELLEEILHDFQGDAKTISIKVRYENFKTITRNNTFKIASSNKNMYLEAIEQLLCVVDDGPIRLFGVKLDNLVHDNTKQMTLC